MAAVDRLGWADGITFSSHGARIGVRVNDPAVMDRLAARVPAGSQVRSSGVVDLLFSFRLSNNPPGARLRRYHLLYANAALVSRTLDLGEALGALETELEAAVMLSARRRLFVRAGVVEWQGGAIVILGPPGGGTSTLVAALVRAGATFGSDRYAVFDERGRVRPDGASGPIGSRPLPVRLILIARYAPNASWSPTQASPGAAVLALLEHAVVARVRPEFALEVLGAVTREAVTMKGVRGEALPVAAAVLGATDREESLTKAGTC